MRENVFFEEIKNSSELTIPLADNANPPRIYSHHLVERDKVLIRFNEPVDVQKDQIEISEKEKPHNKVAVKSVELKNNKTHLYIKTDGLPDTPEKFYTIQLKNIKNHNQVPLSPNPRTVTVVYRPKHFTGG